MPRWCANLSWLFTEYPMLERFAAARQAGFTAVEVLFPYDEPAPKLREMLVDNGLALALINAPPPNYTDRPRGFAAVPGGEETFARDLKRALRVADVLRPARVHLMAGVADGPQARTTMIANLRHALEFAPERQFTIEPLNGDDLPGYFLNDFDLAREIIEEIASPRLRLQFDAYHAQKITGDALAVFAEVSHLIAHIQIAATPDRTEPAEGGIDFAGFFDAVDASGYEGWVSGEYRPSGKTEASLGWMRA